MTKNNTLNLIYVSIIASLCFIINQRTAIYQCAAIFTGIMVVANSYLLRNKAQQNIDQQNTDQQKVDKHKTNTSTYKILLTGIALSAPLYAIMGTSNIAISIASIASLAITGSLSIYLTSVLENKYRLSLALFVSLLVTAIADGFIMSAYFVAFDIFTVSKTMSVLYKELLFKAIYASIVAGTVYSVELAHQSRKTTT